MGQHGRGAAVRYDARDYVAQHGARTFRWENKNLSRVEKVIAFIEELPITKGILNGEKMRLLPRQRQFVVELYSSRSGVERNYNLAIKSEPKGNGKTGLLSALALCHLLGPEAEDRGEVFSAAIDREQASLLFAEMVAILREIPEYMECVNIIRNMKKIEVVKRFKGYPGKGSTYAALSQDARSAHGLAPSVWIYDELAQAKTRELLDNLLNGMGKRDDSLGIVISTQAPSDDHPLSMLIDEGMSGQNPNIYVMLDCAPDDADPWDPKVWKACNQALGVFLNEKEFAIAADRAKRNSAYEAAFRNLRLNQRISPDLDRLTTPSEWKECQAKIDMERLKGRECIGALDLSKTTDLSSLVLVFPDDEKDTGFDIVPFFWTPLGKLDTRLQAEKERLTEWIRRGYIDGIPGPVIRYDFIARKIQELQARYKIKAIAYDNWHFEDLQIELASIGVTNLPVQPFTQGHSKAMAPAVKYFQELAPTKRLRHDGNAMLTASVVNAVVVLDRAGNPMLDKSKSQGPVRIDGAVALVMALGTARRFAAEPPKEFKMFYI